MSQWFCRLAWYHRAGSRVRDSTAPSMHCQSGPRLDRYGWKYTHAAMVRSAVLERFLNTSQL